MRIVIDSIFIFLRLSALNTYSRLAKGHPDMAQTTVVSVLPKRVVPASQAHVRSIQAITVTESQVTK